MATVREVVSLIRNENKAIGADSLLTNRFLASKARIKASLLIKRENSLRRLLSSPSLFTEVSCIKMEEVPLSECCVYRSPKSISRSSKKIPTIGEGLNGMIIQGVFNIEGTSKFNIVTMARFENILKLGLNTSTTYCWFMNGYLYTSNPSLTYIKLVAYFENDIPSNLSDEEGCPCGNTSESTCIKQMDREFNCPGYLIDNVITMVNQDLANFYYRRLVDHTSDNKDDQTNPK